eukprot:COSAG02_NODE_4262_length_5575_cov_7.055698_3_plen_156_part_00
MLLEAKEKRLVAMCEERNLPTSKLEGCDKKRSLARRLAQDGWGVNTCDPQYLDGTTPPEGDDGDIEDNDENGSEIEDENLDDATRNEEFPCILLRCSQFSLIITDLQFLIGESRSCVVHSSHFRLSVFSCFLKMKQCMQHGACCNVQCGTPVRAL